MDECLVLTIAKYSAARRKMGAELTYPGSLSFSAATASIWRHPDEIQGRQTEGAKFSRSLCAGWIFRSMCSSGSRSWPSVDNEELTLQIKVMWPLLLCLHATTSIFVSLFTSSTMDNVAAVWESSLLLFIRKTSSDVPTIAPTRKVRRVGGCKQTSSPTRENPVVDWNAVHSIPADNGMTVKYRRQFLKCRHIRSDGKVVRSNNRWAEDAWSTLHSLSFSRWLTWGTTQHVANICVVETTWGIHNFYVRKRGWMFIAKSKARVFHWTRLLFVPVSKCRRLAPTFMHNCATWLKPHSEAQKALISEMHSRSSPSKSFFNWIRRSTCTVWLQFDEED